MAEFGSDVNIKVRLYDAAFWWKYLFRHFVKVLGLHTSDYDEDVVVVSLAMIETLLTEGTLMSRQKLTSCYFFLK